MWDSSGGRVALVGFAVLLGALVAAQTSIAWVTAGEGDGPEFAFFAFCSAFVGVILVVVGAVASRTRRPE